MRGAVVIEFNGVICYQLILCNGRRVAHLSFFFLHLFSFLFLFVLIVPRVVCIFSAVAARAGRCVAWQIGR